MLISDKEAAARLQSPMNLINRLSAARSNGKTSAMSLFGIGRKEDKKIEEVKEIKEVEQVKLVESLETTKQSFNPFQSKSAALTVPTPSQETTLDTILKDNNSQIRLGLAHDSALELLNNSVALLAAKLDDIKADKLPTVVVAAGKIVESIRKERNEASKNNKDREVHYHFYTPQQKKVSDFKVIDV